MLGSTPEEFACTEVAWGSRLGDINLSFGSESSSPPRQAWPTNRYPSQDEQVVRVVHYLHCEIGGITGSVRERNAALPAGMTVAGSRDRDERVARHRHPVGPSGWVAETGPPLS